MNKPWLCFLIIANLFDIHHCGGGRRPSPSPTRSRTTPMRTSRPSTSTTPYSYIRSSSSTTLTTRRSYVTVGSTNADWRLPPRPGSKDNQNHYQGPQTVVYKTNYYQYPGQYHLPIQSPHPGYYYTPSYHYTSADTGSTALGFFLGYSLAQLTTPTYSHYTFYDGYRPRYDHYTVHHYYHNADSVPKNQEIPGNTIVGCVGDSTTVCPPNTMSLCTSNGALMCVVSTTATNPCTNDIRINCVKSTINCVNNTAPECEGTNSTSISIPCISNAKIVGDVKYENNTIIVDNSVAGIKSSADSASRKKREASENFCVTIVALPEEKPMTEGEKFFEDAQRIVSTFIEDVWGF